MRSAAQGERMENTASEKRRFQILCNIANSSPFVKRNRQIAELCWQGFNRSEIAKFIGLTRQRVQQITRELGVTTKPRKVESTCEICGKSYTKFRSLVVRHERRFCSKECFHKAVGASGEKFPCHVCGTPVHRSPSRKGTIKRVFCSQACYYSVRQDGRYKPSRAGQRKARKVVAKHFPLQPEHVVHHEDKDNRNNELPNLRVFANQSDHMAYHHGVTAVVPIWDGRTVQP